MKVIIFGVGQRLRTLFKLGYLKNVKAVALCDNDINKQGAYFNGVNIIVPEKN